MSMTRSQVDIDLDQLPRMPLTRLRVLWAEQIGKAKPPVQKRLLIRELAWRLQERTHGGVDAETARLLQSAMRAVGQARRDRDADARAAAQPTATNASEAAGPTRAPAPPRVKRSGQRPAALPPSSRMVRLWGGVSHEVTVLDGGKRYRYREHEYRSLSEIARIITGTHWSGPRFFGVAASSEAPNSKGGKR
jgi:hypothetical protein